MKPYTLKVLPLGAEQSCGECQACCTVLGVHDEGILDKPNYERCQHQCDTGCAIYQKRPLSCRHFWCMWTAAGVFPMYRKLRKNILRPDRCGLIFDYDPLGDIIRVWEVNPGAASWKANKKLIQDVATDCKRMAVIIDEKSGRRAKWEDMPDTWRKKGSELGAEMAAEFNKFRQAQ